MVLLFSATLLIRTATSSTRIHPRFLVRHHTSGNGIVSSVAALQKLILLAVAIVTDLDSQHSTDDPSDQIEETHDEGTAYDHQDQCAQKKQNLHFASSIRSSIIEQVIRVEFPPPDKPWSTNQDRNLSPHERAEKISYWKQRATLAWVSYCNGKGIDRHMGPALIRIHVPFKMNRIRDPHNYCGTVVKAIVDGLVLAGAWEDDTPEFVEHISPILYKGDDVIIELHPKANARLPCEHGQYVTHHYGKGTTCNGFTTLVW